MKTAVLLVLYLDYSYQDQNSLFIPRVPANSNHGRLPSNHREEHYRASANQREASYLQSANPRGDNYPSRVPKFFGSGAEAIEERKVDSGRNTFFHNFFGTVSAKLEKLFENEAASSARRQLKRKQKHAKDRQSEDYDWEHDESRDSVSYPQCSVKSNICQPSGENVVCGEPVRSGRIVNGQDAAAAAYPWTVGIQFIDKLYCGGSLITNMFVLTAAHCMKGINHSRIRIVLGDHDRRRKSQVQVTRTIERVFIHAQFVKKTFNNDIALIKLSQPVKFSSHIRPVCLPVNNRSYNNQNTTVVGWGKLAELGRPAEILQEVVVPVISQKKCRKSTNYRSKEITENMFCAGYDKGVLDACQGDSGGPMVWRGDENNAWAQIGIVSWGQGCARKGYPGVYTRIGKYLDWIINIVEDNGSCFCNN